MDTIGSARRWILRHPSRGSEEGYLDVISVNLPPDAPDAWPSSGELAYAVELRGSPHILGWGALEAPQGPQDPTVQTKAASPRGVARFTWRERYAPPVLVDGPAGSIKALSVLADSGRDLVPLDDEERGKLDALLRSQGKPAPGEPDAPVDTTFEHVAGEGEVPFERLGELRPSPTIEAVLERAHRLVVEADSGGAVNSSHLIFALVDHAREQGEHPLLGPLLRDGIVRSYESQVREVRRRYLERPVGAKVPQAPRRAVTGNTWSILQAAARIRDEIDASAPLSTRHLLAELLTYPVEKARGGALVRLREVGVDFGELRRRFHRLVTGGQWPGESAAWRRLLDQRIDRGLSACVVNADTVEGEDCLDVDHDARAMARLIASKALRPPLSIGVFGRWGAGKSFMMSRIRKELDDIRARVRRGQEQDAAHRELFWPNVVPIDFNVWHYIDSNLWASLVCHIFDELKRYDPEAPDRERSAISARLQQQLDDMRVAREARDATEEQKRRAELECDAARRDKELLEQTFAQKKVALERGVAASIWGREALARLAAEADGLSKPLKTLGVQVSSAGASARSLHEQLKELNTSAGKIRALWGSMLQGKGGFLAVGIYVAVSLAFVLIVPQLLSEEQLTPILAVIGQIAGVISAASAWLTRNIKPINEALEPVAALHRRFEEAIAEAEKERAEELAEASAEVERLQQEAEAASRRFAEAEKALTAARTRYQETISGADIKRYIERRARSGEYHRHLGLVATIHNDFKELSERIWEHNELRLEPTREAPGAAAEKDLGINRIVLFIDDLDRCPPERVVDVLQAIHLLLAFELFVVVVGVDSRWVSYSLEEKYPGMLVARTPRPDPAGGGARDGEAVDGEAADGDGTQNGDGTQDGAAPPDYSASPRDYLEKIFQIPFWLRGIEPEEVGRLIDDLVRREQTADAAPGSGEPGQPPQIAPPATPGSPGSTPPPQPGPDEPPGRPGEPPGAEQPATSPPGTPAPPGPGVEAISLKPHEVQAIKELSPIIGRSPRETKRFLNVYRLFKASQRLVSNDEFVGTARRPGVFPRPMFLLAFATGLPGLSSSLFRELGAAAPDSAVRPLLERLGKPDGRSDRARDEVDRLRTFLEATAAREATAGWRDLTVQSLRPHVLRVSQFSFEEPVG